MVALLRALVMMVGLSSFLLNAVDQPADLVNVLTIDDSLKLDIRYATGRNFLWLPLYTKATCYLREGTVRKLAAVQEELRLFGLSLVIWDGYHPLRMNSIFDHYTPKAHRHGNPVEGTNHNRGAAVDVTLATVDGKPLLMPSDFDDFTQAARADYYQLSPDVINHRALLIRIMEKHGFMHDASKWWHFNDADAAQYAVIDIPLDELQ